MSILCWHKCMMIRLNVFRISALYSQRRPLNGLRVIHRWDEYSSQRGLYYAFFRMNILRHPESSETSFHELTEFDSAGFD